MNMFEKILYFLQGEMETPKAYGWFHFLWIFLMTITIIILFLKRKSYNEKQLKIVIGTYSITALILEVLKQLIWSFNYDATTNLITWEYEWYSFPFQLCTTPIYVCLICLFLKDNKIRKALFSYISFITILGSISTILIPDSCFVSDILVNIHTMWLHLGSFVISVYLIMNKEVKLTKDYLKRSFIVFIIFIIIAELLNLTIYNSEILGDETFNMFYISPYFTSSLPVFDIIQEHVPFIVYLLIYTIALIIGGTIIYYISLGIKKIASKFKK